MQSSPPALLVNIYPTLSVSKKLVEISDCWWPLSLFIVGLCHFNPLIVILMVEAETVNTYAKSLI